MGCDIHAAIEYEQYPGQGEAWVELARDLWLSRNYEVFGRMAGVRGSVRMYEPRGFPSDMRSELTGDHTPSWLAPNEFRRVLEACEYNPCPDYWASLAMLEELEKRGKRARLVFNFDN